MDGIFPLLMTAWMVYMVIRIYKSMREHEQFIDHIKEELDERIRVVVMEPLSEHNTILAYDAENNQFLGQGSDKTSMIRNILSRFPNKIFLVEEEAYSTRPQPNTAVKVIQ